MAVAFRAIDTGVRDGRKQIAFDEALVELHHAGKVPDTLRFLRFPPTALVGRHQAIRREVKVDHCNANGIGLARRITGGGAIYLDENQVGWELVLSRKRLPMQDLGAYTAAICEAASDGLAKAFSIPATYRPRNDIVVEGQKICGTGGFFDGDTLIYQGTVLVDVDPAKMMACLNVPDVKPAARDLDKAEQRVTTLKALLGKAPSVDDVHAALIGGFERRLGIAVERGAIGQGEEDLAAELGREMIETDDFVFEIDDPGGEGFVSAKRDCPGGTIEAFLRIGGSDDRKRISEVLITGNFFAAPPRTVLDLEARLRGSPVEEVDAKIDQHFAEAEIGLITISPDDVKSVLGEALSQ